MWITCFGNRVHKTHPKSLSGQLQKSLIYAHLCPFMPETNLFLSIGRGRNRGWTPPIWKLLTSKLLIKIIDCFCTSYFKVLKISNLAIHNISHTEKVNYLLLTPSLPRVKRCLTTTCATFCTRYWEVWSTFTQPMYCTGTSSLPICCLTLHAISRYDLFHL